MNTKLDPVLAIKIAIGLLLYAALLEATFAAGAEIAIATQALGLAVALGKEDPEAPFDGLGIS